MSKAKLPVRRLGDVCHVQKGKTITEKETTDGQIPVVAGGSKPAYFHNVSNRAPGTITISASGYAGFVSYWRVPIWASDCITVEPLDPTTADSSYLFHALKYLESTVLRSLQRGAAQKHVYAKDVQEIELPIPTVDEQQRIAAILDAADALRTKRRQAIEKVGNLAQSIFADMFGDPIRNEQDWEMRSLESVARGIFDCPHSTPVWSDKGKICLRTSNLGRGTWVWTDKRFVSDITFEERSRRAFLEPGDIVLSREGTVGVAAIVPPEIPMCMGQRLVQVRANQNVVLPRFLLDVLLFILEPNRISKVMAGSTSKHINVKELRTLQIPIPPLKMQDAYVAAAESLTTTLGVMSEDASSMEALFASIQHRAFRGEL